MAPHNSAKAEKEHRVSSILGFASQLQKQLDLNILDSSTAAELAQHFKKLFPVPHPSLAEQLDTLGRTLWNSAIELRQSNKDVSNLFPQLRVFAFHLLDMAHQAAAKEGSNSTASLIRILRVSLKAARSCIDHNELDLGILIFQRSASYIETTDREIGPRVKRNNDGEEGIQADVIEGLAVEYFISRAALAWKQGRVDLTEYWLGKFFISGDGDGTASLIEKKADLLYEVGKAALKKKQYDIAAKWLEKSYNSLDTLDREALNPDCCELRFAAISDLVRALIGLKNDDSLTKATELLSLLQLENAEFKISTCLLQIKLFSVQTPVDKEKCYEVLLLIINSVHLIENNFKVMMKEIHSLRKLDEIEGRMNDQSVGLACQALDALLPRVLQLDNQSWIEKVVITRIWIVVLDCPTSHSAARLMDLFDEILSTTGISFTLEATHAAQSLMWKHIDTQEGEPETWCRLTCHGLFQNAGDINKSKLGRKMMLNALAKGDAVTAREAYFRMPESGKTAPVTKYIMYRVALRSGDADLASESLEGVLRSSKIDAKFLYACALEAQQQGDRQQAIAVLQKVLEYYNYDIPEGVYLPALLRSTAKMIMVELNNNSIPKHEALLDLCKLFEGAMSQAKRFHRTPSGDSTFEGYKAELKWFAGNSYNLALTHLADMHPELLLRFMTVCVAFVDFLRHEDSGDNGLVHRLLLCRFLAASALVVLARSEDNMERSLSFYLDVRRQIEAFQKSLKDASHSAILQPDTQVDLVMKDFELLKYDLEALLKLQHWNDLERVLDLCLAQQHNTRWGTISDLIIHIHTHISNAQLDARYQNSKRYEDVYHAGRSSLIAEIPLVMEKIINATWNHQDHDTRKLARWIRCLFQMTLSINPEMALRCVDNARAMANRMRAVQATKLYPAEELAWLATSTFNHAVDLYCGDDKNASRPWAEAALNLAMEGKQDLGLHAVLQAKWIRVQAELNT